MSYLDPPDSGRRFTGLAVVTVFHVFLAYALLTGLARKVVEVVIPPLETKLIEEVKPPQVENKPPPPPPPKLAAPPPPFIPPPEVRVEAPPVANTITAVSDVKPASEAPMPQPPGQTRTSAVVNSSSCAKPEYPLASRRAQETGIVTMSFLIGVDGSVIDSKVVRSSGSRRLDEAARNGLSLCRFKPATVDGKPEQTWSRIEYEWILR